MWNLWRSHVEVNPLQTSEFVSPLVVFVDDVLKPLLRLILYFAVVFGVTLFVGVVTAFLEAPLAHQTWDAEYAEFVAQNFTAAQAAMLRSRFTLGVPYDESPTAWTVMNSQYFATVMLMTIGYGDMVPVTGLGRTWAVASGLIGIPLMGYLLHIAGKHFVQAVFGMQLMVCSLFCRVRYKEGAYYSKARRMLESLNEAGQLLNLHDLHRVLREWDDSGHPLSWFEVCTIMEAADIHQTGYLEREEVRAAVLNWARRTMRRDQIRNPTILLYIATMVFSWLVMGAVIFSYLQAISFGDAFWFAFVTLCTIGYGDITPTTLPCRLFWFVFVYIGFGIMTRLLVAISYFVGAGAERAVSHHIHFSLYYDWDFQAERAGRCCNRLKNVIPAVVSLGYAALGGFLFMELDQPLSEFTHTQIKAVWDSVGFTVGQRAYLKARLDLPDPEWDFEDSMQVAAASMATIGYGNLVPNTTGGRSALLLYATLGIGIVGLSLSRFADLASGAITSTYNLIARLIGIKHRLWNERLFERHVQSLFEQIDASSQMTVTEACAIIESFQMRAGNLGEEIEVQKKVMIADTGEGFVKSGDLMITLSRWMLQRMQSMSRWKLVLNTLMLAALALAFAAIFGQTDGWTYDESLWFTWVTVTTIGFGDLVPTAQVASSMANVALISLNLGFFANCLGSGCAVLYSIAVQVRAALARWKERRRGAHDAQESARGISNEELLTTAHSDA